MASNLFEMGYETESENEQFEVAKKVIQLAQNAAQIAQAAPPHIPPQVAAQQAVAQAARELGVHAEAESEEEFGGYGYRRRGSGGQQYGGYGGQQYGGGYQTQSGRWSRRGRRIVLHGVY
jgi:hypothetical protein